MECDGGAADGGVAAGEEDYVQLAVTVDEVAVVCSCGGGFQHGFIFFVKYCFDLGD